MSVDRYTPCPDQRRSLCVSEKPKPLAYHAPTLVLWLYNGPVWHAPISTHHTLLANHLAVPAGDGGRGPAISAGAVVAAVGLSRAVRLGGSAFSGWHLAATPPTGRIIGTVAGTALLAFGSTGWRASHYAARILPAHLQQRDILVQGQVMSLPQWLPDGVRFNFAVTHATLNGQTVRLPNTLSLAWYLPRPNQGQDVAPETSFASAQGSTPTQPPATYRCVLCVQPGERWQMTVRLKQPHGSRNPFGFDYERWLWEQGLGATGYVRTGDQGHAPEKIGQAHPLDMRVWRDRARLHAREAVYQALLPKQTSSFPGLTQPLHLQAHRQPPATLLPNALPHTQPNPLPSGPLASWPHC